MHQLFCTKKAIPAARVRFFSATRNGGNISIFFFGLRRRHIYRGIHMVVMYIVSYISVVYRLLILHLVSHFLYFLYLLKIYVRAQVGLMSVLPKMEYQKMLAGFPSPAMLWKCLSQYLNFDFSANFS